jgi:hypothetical protein
MKIWDFMAPLIGVQQHSNFDNRVVYDEYRRRFWITSMFYPDGGAKAKILALLSQIFMAAWPTSPRGRNPGKA